MKICTKCCEEKPLEAFPWKNMAAGKRGSWCKDCQKAFSRNHYELRSQHYRDKSRRNRPALRQRNKKFIVDYLLSHPCVDCGEGDIEVLEFDHIEPVLGRGNRVTTLLTSASIAAIVKEIEKCQVRCANCHRRRTRRQFGFLRAPVVESADT